METAGHDVEAVPGVADGRQALEHGRFDLVLLDVNMPHSSGLYLIRSIREGLYRDCRSWCSRHAAGDSVVLGL